MKRKEKRKQGKEYTQICNKRYLIKYLKSHLAVVQIFAAVSIQKCTL